MIEEKIALTTYDGTKVIGSLTIPDNEGVFPVAITLHGFGSTKEAGRVWSNILNPLGIGTLGIDFRGAGASGGTYRERTLSGFLKDAEAALEYTYQHKRVNKNKIAVVGHSMGGVTAILLASMDQRISTLVVTSPAIQPGKAIAGLYDTDDFSKGEERGFVELRKDGPKKILNYTFFQDANTFDIIKIANKIPYRFLVIAGKKDTVVSFSDIEQFVDSVKNAELFPLSNSEHNLKEDWEAVENAARKWFEEWLQR